MNGKETKTPSRQFHSLDGLDTIGDLMSESKTVTAVVSKGKSDRARAVPQVFSVPYPNPTPKKPKTS